jgi:DNA-binding CsgD family transcriptional regulator
MAKTPPPLECFRPTQQAWAAISCHLLLSPREIQITQLVFQDRKELAIAENLGMSPHTVRSHIERLYRKLGVRSRVDLILRVTGTFLALTEQGHDACPPICGKRKPCPLAH